MRDIKVDYKKLGHTLRLVIRTRNELSRTHPVTSSLTGSINLGNEFLLSSSAGLDWFFTRSRGTCVLTVLHSTCVPTFTGFTEVFKT